MAVMDPLFSPRQWAERRQAELSRLAALQAAADAVGVALQPSAPEGAHCDVCNGPIVDGLCATCYAVYMDGIRDGIRVPGKKAPIPFSDESAVTS
jgi:hypothetical protein